MALFLILTNVYKNSNKKTNNEDQIKKIKNKDKDVIMDSIVLYDIMKKNLMMTIDETVSLINLYNKILYESNHKKNTQKLYKDEFIISNKNEYIQLYRIGRYKGDIYAFTIGDKLCVMFEFSLDIMKYILSCIQQFNNLNKHVKLKCIRLYNKRYKKYCNDIYFITYVDIVEF